MKKLYSIPTCSVSECATGCRICILSAITAPTVSFQDVEFTVVDDKDISEGGDWDQNWLN